MRVILIVTLGTLFTGLTETFDRKFVRMPLGSKYGELKEFYKLLSDFKNHEPIPTETKDRENKIFSNVNQLYNIYFDTYKKNYDSENLNERDEKIFLTLTSLKYLVRKNKNQSKLKKILKEKGKNHYGLE